MLASIQPVALGRRTDVTHAGAHAFRAILLRFCDELLGLSTCGDRATSSPRSRQAGRPRRTTEWPGAATISSAGSPKHVVQVSAHGLAGRVRVTGLDGGQDQHVLLHRPHRDARSDVQVLRWMRRVVDRGDQGRQEPVLRTPDRSPYGNEGRRAGCPGRRSWSTSASRPRLSSVELLRRPGEAPPTAPPGSSRTRRTR